MRTPQARKPSAPEGARSAWRLYPWAILGALGLVIVVNLFMAYQALHTFPGVSVHNEFDHSNSYDAVLSAQARQNALNWRVVTSVDETSHVVVKLEGAGGSPLRGAAVHGVANRVMGPDHTTRLACVAVAPGRYRSATPLTMPGQWSLALFVRHGSNLYRASRRLEAP